MRVNKYCYKADKLFLDVSEYSILKSDIVQATKATFPNYTIRTTLIIDKHAIKQAQHHKSQQRSPTGKP